MKNFFSIKRFRSIVKKEFIQVKRDPISMRIPFVMTIAMMLLFGYAVKVDVNKIQTVVFDGIKTQESREYIKRFTESDYFEVKHNVSSKKELDDIIDSGKAKAGIIIPPNYSPKIKDGEKIQLLIDGTDPTTAKTALNKGMIISQQYAKFLNATYIDSPQNAKDMVNSDIQMKVLYNPDLKSEKFTIPGLVGLILQNITIMLTAFALVREKERGTIEQLIVTPVKPLELILGKLVPYVVIGYSGFLFALSICVFWFKVTIAGSLPLLLLLGFLFVYCSLAIGMLISTFAKNQLQAMMVMIMVLLPSILLSGFVFPREAMPNVINYLGYALPLTYFLEIVRGIVLKGVGMEFLWQDVLALCIFTVAIITIATVRFKKSLD